MCGFGFANIFNTIGYFSRLVMFDFIVLISFGFIGNNLLLKLSFIANIFTAILVLMAIIKQNIRTSFNKLMNASVPL